MSSCCPKLGQTAGRFVKPKRSVSTVFIHCTATSNRTFDADRCNDYHLSLGWACIGYHYLITSAGIVQHGRDLERVPSAQSGYNTGSIAISLNGLEKKDFSETQFQALRGLCREIDGAYGGKVRFRGHCEVAAKACPVFDYREVLGLDSAGYMTGYVPPEDPTMPPVKMCRVDVDLAQMGAGDIHPHVRLICSILGVKAPPDDCFNIQVLEAVERFQRQEGLHVDGICGPATWERLLDVGDEDHAS